MAEWVTAGKVRMTPKGVWSSGTAYNILDVVTNDGGTVCYVAKQDVPAGILLTNTTYWDVIANSSDSVKYTAQTLTEAQKSAVRNNIDVLSSILSPQSYGEVSDNTVYTELSQFPKNSMIGVTATAFNSMVDKPFESNTGMFVETFSPMLNSTMYEGIQRLTNWTGTIMAVRAYVAGAYRNWVTYSNSADIASDMSTLEGKLAYSPRSVQNYFDNSVYTMLADLPNNTIVGFGKDAVNGLGTVEKPGLSDRPFDVSDGIFVETYSTIYNNKSGTAQRITAWDGSFVAMRLYISNVWREWRVFYPDSVVETITVRLDGSGDYTSVVSAIQETMASGLAGKYHQYVIDIGEGEFDMSGAADLAAAGTISYLGLFVMPYTKIRGAGKDRTILKLYYTGDNSSVMNYVSALNMPYESELSDLTITVQNIRYPVHSADAHSGGSSNANSLLTNNKIVLRNVRLEHLGFDSSHTGSDGDYRFPCAWGSGNWDANDREFINCEFFAKQTCAWLNHDHTENTKDSNFHFVNCTIHSDSSAFNGTADSASRAGCALTSWGAKAKIHVSFENCIIVPNVGLNINEQSSSTIETVVTAYDVKADNDILVIESTTNNSHTGKTIRVAGCIEGRYTPSAGIIAYKPVSMERMYLVRSYASSLPRHGIALNSAAQGEMVIVQTRGFVSLVMLGATGFSLGDTLGWNGSAWVVDTANPILKVIDNGLTGMFM